jgi:hypothetical protein
MGRKSGKRHRNAGSSKTIEHTSSSFFPKTDQAMTDTPKNAQEVSAGPRRPYKTTQIAGTWKNVQNSCEV